MSQICRFTVPASRDLEGILDYVAQQSGVDAAEALLKQVNDKCQQLIQFPGMGKRRDDWSEGLRSVSVKNYLIVYRAISEGIAIMRIVSGYRDLEALFEE